MTTSTLRTPRKTARPVILSTPEAGPHPEVTRLLAAAVVSRQFRQLLLSDPVHALDIGYQGEKFSFTKDEHDLITSIRATSLPELAGQLISSLNIRAYANQDAPNTGIERTFIAK
ncbi:MAG: hypothetical protein L3J16_02365 [Anaerolineales bacterium]|nr:hypothetical protein [Anaerolineales bacterium]